MRQREADRYVDSISLTDPSSATQMKNLLGTLGTAAGLGTTALGDAALLPFLAPGTVGGTLIGETAGGMAMGELLNKGAEMLTGRNWGDNVRHTLESTFGYNPESWSSLGQGAYNFLIDMSNPGYYNSRWLKSGINAAEQGLTTMVENTLPTARNMYLSYNLNKVPNNLFSDIRTPIYPDMYHRSIYIPQNVPQTRWLAEDMSIPE